MLEVVYTFYNSTRSKNPDHCQNVDQRQVLEPLVVYKGFYATLKSEIQSKSSQAHKKLFLMLVKIILTYKSLTGHVQDVFAGYRVIQNFRNME